VAATTLNETRTFVAATLNETRTPTGTLLAAATLNEIELL
jgi:hypothetical protein